MPINLADHKAKKELEELSNELEEYFYELHRLGKEHLKTMLHLTNQLERINNTTDLMLESHIHLASEMKTHLIRSKHMMRSLYMSLRVDEKELP